MNSKTAIALAAALSTSLLAAPAVAHAESQFEWVQRQLQVTDGYAPPPPVVSSKDGIRSGTATYEGTALTVTRDPAQSDWVMHQLQITDGYAPFDGVPGYKDAVVTEPDNAGPTAIGDRTQSEWFAQQLQITDGYASSPVARARDEKGTVTSAYQGVGTTQN